MMSAEISFLDSSSSSFPSFFFRGGLQLIFGLFLCIALAAAPLRAANVTVHDRTIMVNGSSFTVKGVCYSPVPPGSDWQYAWGSNPAIYEKDLALIKAMGANTVRTYQDRNITREFLDAAHAHGIYVIVGWGENLWSKDFSNAATRAQYVDLFKTFVNAWKDFPAVLMWSFGNEVEEHTISKPGWYTLIQEAAAAAHGVDADHLVTTANQEVFEIGISTMNTTDAVLASLDVWGVNVYRGRSFGSDFFSDMRQRTAKPFFVSEWGCDAYNGTLDKEDRELQDRYVSSLWQEIAANLAADGKDCSGGTVFEWTDEWWKGAADPSNPNTIGLGGLQGASVQDTAADWTNFAYTDDPKMNEEWWGIVSIGDGEDVRAPRLAFHTLRGMWSIDASASAASASSLFKSDVRNYPNPFVPGRASTRIEFTVNGTPSVEVGIYDLMGRKIVDVGISHRYDSGLLVADWNGRDERNSVMPAGLYLAKVTAKTSDRTETRYRKIAVVK